MDEGTKARYGLGVGVSCLGLAFLVWGARRGCPIYGQGAKKLAWRYLDITLHTLARAITEPGDDTAELAWPGYALMSDIIYGGKQ